NTVDPLALMSDVSNPQRYLPSSSTSSSTQVSLPFANNPHLDSGLSPADKIIENLTNTLALLTQSYKTFLPQTNIQLRTSSNTRNQAMAQKNGVALDAEQLLFLAGGQDNAFDDDVDEQPYKGESIHDYYVWFAKIINDMRNIKMTMSQMQLNSKFVNNMLPEWGRFMTVVKLNRGLRDSIYDQLYLYLKQHKTHAKENIMMLE
nr:integrase, catalytic region, zinc finger, CCHC-type, peptidase aspartic, catalytic [Tanacetum cinerariifolium]